VGAGPGHTSMLSMHGLEPGNRHSIQATNNHNQTIVYVKLTDSALRSFEDYLKQRAVLDKSGAGGPTIQFSNSGGGAISVPVGGERGHVNYSFGLSNEDGGSNKQGSTACLRATNNSLETVGTIGETLRVKASDDVYQRIGQRFNDVKMENEKKTTVLLDNKDKKKASVPKPSVVRKVPSQVPPQRERERERGGSSMPSMPGFGTSGTSSGPGRGAGLGQGVAAQARPHHSPSMGVRQPQVSSTGYVKNAQPQQQPERKLEKFPQAHKSSKPPPTTNPEIMKRSLRERLIHLLAVRTYKKPELIARIQRDGLKEKDRKSITPVLREVSECKNNVHELKRSMWNDVQEDWPGYTESDKVMLKRRKPQNLTPPGSDTGSTSSGHSPSSTTPASPPQISNPLKRNGGGFFPGETIRDRNERERDRELAGQEPSPKKKRVSSYKRPGDSWSKSPGLSVSPRLTLTHDRDASLGDVGRHSVSPRLTFDPLSTHDDSAPDWDQFSPGEQQQESRERVERKERKRERSESKGRHRAVQERQQESNSESEATLQEETETGESGEHRDRDRDTDGQDQEPPQLQQLLQNKNKDFLELYTPIIDSEQRNRYKAEFNQHYTKYIGLHGVLNKVSKTFSNLEHKLRETPRGTRQFQDIKAKIREEYQRSIDDTVYQEARSSFQYLHEKLDHIKKLVHEYDTSNLR